jgi:bifunctional DNase/RNase
VREIRIRAVGVDARGYRPVLLLEETIGDRRLLPVWIGPAEANVIILERQGIAGPRPLTHHLIGNIVAAFGRRLDGVCITEVRDSVFYAELIFDQGLRVSARVSDAVALAVHLDVPIQVDEAVLDLAAISNTVLRFEGEDDARADEVEAFRRFLDAVSPEDFDPS